MNGTLSRVLGTARAAAPSVGSVTNAPVAPSVPAVINLQPLVILMGATSSATVVQPRWLDALWASTVQLRVEILSISGCSLILESSPREDASDEDWDMIETFIVATGPKIIVVGSGSDEYTPSFSRFIRWRIAPTDPWEICFRIKALPGLGVTDWAEEPRVV